MNFTSLRVSLDEACITDFIRRYHFDEKDKKEILRINRLIAPRVHAQFHYVMESSEKCADTNVARYDEGSGDVPENFATVVVTLGKAFDEYQESLQKKNDIHGAYIIDCLGLELLRRAYDEIDEKLYEFTGLFAGDYIFAGEDRLPLSKVPELMTRLGQKLVIYNDAYVLIPKKSVVMEIPLYKVHKKKHGLCAFCSNEGCENRRESVIELAI